MEKFCPTERVEGDRIVLGEPQAAPQPEEVVVQSWTLPAIVTGLATTLVTIGLYAFFNWLESRSAGTGK